MLGRFIRTFHVTTLGWIVLLLFPVAVVVFVIGPSSAQAPALVVAVLVVLFVGGSTFSGGRRGIGRTEAARNAAAEFHSRKRSEPIEQEVDDPEAWRKERERRERAEQEQASVRPDQASWPQ